jgi:hypothetical protein
MADNIIEFSLFEGGAFIFSFATVERADQPRDVTTDNVVRRAFNATIGPALCAGATTGDVCFGNDPRVYQWTLNETQSFKLTQTDSEVWLSFILPKPA